MSGYETLAKPSNAGETHIMSPVKMIDFLRLDAEITVDELYENQSPANDELLAYATELSAKPDSFEKACLFIALADKSGDIRANAYALVTIQGIEDETIVPYLYRHLGMNYIAKQNFITGAAIVGLINPYNQYLKEAKFGSLFSAGVRLTRREKYEESTLIVESLEAEFVKKYKRKLVNMANNPNRDKTEEEIKMLSHMMRLEPKGIPMPTEILDRLVPGTAFTNTP